MSSSPEVIVHCQSCGGGMNVAKVAPFSNVECPSCGQHMRVKTEFGPYQLVRRHAVGGMSSVFIAHDSTLERDVALKILSEEYSADEKRIGAFVEEARITASFSHPHVVRVLTTGRAFGRFYIAMEFVPGGHFEHHIHERGSIPVKEMLPLAVQIAEGLKAAQVAGLIHRDIKPGNILLDSEGNAKIVDFGLALVTKGGKARAKEIWATPYYVPPETIEGQPEDFRSDIYAFGATLYHALAGKPPCGEESMATDVLREAKKRVVPLGKAAPHLPDDVCQIVDRAMAYEPKDRFGSYEEIVSRLQAASQRLKSSRRAGAETADAVNRRRAAKKRNERMALAAAAVVLLVAAWAGVWWISQGRTESPVAPAVVEVAEPELPVPVQPDVGRLYRTARAAVESGNFAAAAVDFERMRDDAAVPEPTRTWAGVEAVAALFLDGRPEDARQAAERLLRHAEFSPSGDSEIALALMPVVARLGELPPLLASEAAGGDSSAPRVMGWMLAGLKNWEQGLMEPAVACFEKVGGASPSAEDAWLGLYQDLAGRHLKDHALLGGPWFGPLPAGAEASRRWVDELNTVLTRLATHGRARFNVKARQVDLMRHAEQLEKRPKQTPGPAAAEPPPLAQVLAVLGELSAGYRFYEAARYLRGLPGDPEGATRDSLLAVAESAAVFLADLESDLAREALEVDLALRSGERVSRLSVNGAGERVAAVRGGGVKAFEWSEFGADALIELHRILVKSPKSELERFRRHECAIAFDWLAGDRDRANLAAVRLAQDHPIFKRRWDVLAVGLP
jgi:eukaryotic-like serine/threonine-protein kinase